jgi:hypothetical protein
MAKVVKIKKAAKPKTARVRGIGKTVGIDGERFNIVSCHREKAVADEKAASMKATHKTKVILNSKTGSHCLAVKKK